MTTTVDGPTSTLAPLRTIDITPPTTLAVPTDTTPTVGYVVTVVDGATFDLQQGASPTQRFVIPHIQVPDVGTCEGLLARSLLAQIIHGKQVRVTPDGLVWQDDIDVGGAMVAYGYATHVGEWYQAADAQSVDIDCTATTTSTTVRPAPPKKKPPTTQPKRKTPVRTTVEQPAETEPAPEVTD